MSNFICSECGFTNIDCGKDGYKTLQEIELEKNLDIAVKALEKIGKVNTKKAIDSFAQCQMIAEVTLANIKEIK